MKFDCGPTYQERVARKRDAERDAWAREYAHKSNWHPHFAWLPTQIGSHDCRWLETIERRGRYVTSIHGNYWAWEYREKVVRTNDLS